jgi:hypothetical protein
MPTERDLPASLSRLPYYQAAQIDPGRDFDNHVQRLIRQVEQLSKSPPPPPPPIPHKAQAQVIQAGKFEWGSFRAFSDGSIEVETNGERQWYRSFAELERSRKSKRDSSSDSSEPDKPSPTLHLIPRR